MGKVSNARRRPSTMLSVVVCFVVVAAIPMARHAGPQQPKIRVEKKPRHISAGRGQAPFDVTRHLIPLGKIQSGGPPKDSIPALTDPDFIPVSAANRILHRSDVVLGVEFDGIAKAYPVRILNWHEIVNDEVGRQEVLVSW